MKNDRITKIRIWSFLLCFVIIISEINVLSINVRAFSRACESASVSGNLTVSQDSATEEKRFEEDEPELDNTKPDQSVSDNTVSDNTVSGNDAKPDQSVSDNTVSDNTVSGNDTNPEQNVPENTVSNNTVSNNTVSENNTKPDDNGSDIGGPSVPEIIFYDISVSNNSLNSGFVYVKNSFGMNISKSVSGKAITVSVIPQYGYIVSDIQVTDALGNIIPLVNNCFVMPDCDVVIDVTYDKERYNVLKEVTGLGMVHSDKVEAFPGEKVSFITLAQSGYKCTSVTVRALDGFEIPFINGYFIMPACDVVISAKFTLVPKQYEIKKAQDAELFGSINVVEKSVSGNIISIDVAAKEYYRVKAVSVNCINQGLPVQITEDNTGIFKFVMPDSDVEIFVWYEQYVFDVSVCETVNGQIVFDGTKAAIGEEVCFDVNPDSGYEVELIEVRDVAGNVIKTGECDFVMPASDVTIKVLFRKIKYHIFTDITGNGKININETWVYGGEKIQFSVEPDAGWEIQDISVKDGNGVALSVYKNAFKMPSANVYIKVTLSKVRYSILVENAENGKVTVSQKDACQGDFIKVQAEPYEGYDLQQIKVLDLYNREIETVDNGFEMPLGNVKVSVLFVKHKYSINVEQALGGKIFVDKEMAVKGDKVFVSIIPDSGYELSRLSVYSDDKIFSEINENVDSYSFEMPLTDVRVIAEFSKIKPPAKYNVLVKTDIQNGKVVVSQKQAVKGEEIVVIGMPDNGYVLESITIVDANGEEINVVDDQFVMPESDVHISAVFTKFIMRYKVSVEGDVLNGKVTVDKTLAEEGEKVCISVVPDEGYRLKELVVSDKMNNHLSFENQTFIMPAKDVRIHALFEKDVLEIAVKSKNSIKDLIEKALSETENADLSIDRYVSSDKKIATVSSKGVVSGKKTGMVTITAQHKINKKEYIDLYSFEIYVRVPVMDKNVVLNFYEPVDMNKYLKDVPYGQDVTWSVSDKKGKIATINKNTGVLDVKKDGKITVTCTIGNEKNAVKLKTTVKIKSIVFSVKDNSFMRKGTLKNIILKNVSEDAEVQWDVDNTEVIQIVNVNAFNKIKIKAVSQGVATLTARVDGKECKVHIVVK